MLITNEITIDLQHLEVTDTLEAVQYDANTRAVKVTLLNGGESWIPPAGAVASVAFKKPDGTSGWYDKLPDNSAACSLAGNAVTAVFAPQMLTAAGKVSAAVIFQDSKLNQLATFVFTVEVQANPAAGKGISNDYYKYSTMEQLSAAVDAWLTETEAEKNDFLNKADAALDAMRDVITASDSAAAIVCEESGSVISVSDASDRLLHGLTLYGKTIQNGTPTPTSPMELVSVGAGGAINTTVCGKNLLPPKTTTSGGFNGNGDGTYTAKADATTEIGKITLIAGVTYALSATRVSGSGPLPCVMFRHLDSQSTPKSNYSNTAVPVIYTPDETITLRILLQSSGASTVCTVGDVFAVQCEVGSVATEYEPYKGQTLTASTPNGLPGIPVTSGGNYTDEKGQQWICDYKDYARGVYVQRIEQSRDFELLSTADGFSNYRYASNGRKLCGGINAPALCNVTNKYAYHTQRKEHFYVSEGYEIVVYLPEAFDINVVPIVAYAVLATPIETALPAEEMAACYATHSNKPNTTAFNDAGAGMKLAYAADTKLYIDNKFGELAAALVHNT